MPIIAVSASVFEDQLQEVMEAGASEFLRKPLREEELYSKVVRFLPFEFEYGEDGEVEITVTEASPAELDYELAQLPHELYNQLIMAARGLDKTKLLELIAPFAETIPRVVEQLHTLADTYRFDLIEDIIVHRMTTAEMKGEHHG